MITDIFKIGVFHKVLNLDTKKIEKYCLKLKKENPTRNISNVGGWQSNNLQGEHLVLNELFEDIEHYSNEFAKSLDIKTPLKLENIWININEYKDWNMVHNHPGSTFSGVYYVNEFENSGSLNFSNGYADVLQCIWPDYKIEKFNEYNSLWRKVPPIKNNLIIFPAFLNHFVSPNLNKNKKRISISFNIVENY